MDAGGIDATYFYLQQQLQILMAPKPQSWIINIGSE